MIYSKTNKSHFTNTSKSTHPVAKVIYEGFIYWVTLVILKHIHLNCTVPNYTRGIYCRQTIQRWRTGLFVLLGNMFYIKDTTQTTQKNCRFLLEEQAKRRHPNRRQPKEEGILKVTFGKCTFGKAIFEKCTFGPLPNSKANENTMATMLRCPNFTSLQS